MPRVEVAQDFRGPTDGVSVLDIDGDTVRECIEAVEDRYPGFSELIFDTDGGIRRGVQLALNNGALPRDGVDVPIAETDIIKVLDADS